MGAMLLLALNLEFLALEIKGTNGEGFDQSLNRYNAEIFLYKPRRPEGIFKFVIIINGLVSSFRFI